MAGGQSAYAYDTLAGCGAADGPLPFTLYRENKEHRENSEYIEHKEHRTFLVSY
jgi:hypothetical protein